MATQCGKFYYYDITTDYKMITDSGKGCWVNMLKFTGKYDVNRNAWRE